MRVIVDSPDGAPWSVSSDGHVKEMTLRAYIELLRSPERASPCYMALEPLTRLPGLEGEVDFRSLCPAPPSLTAVKVSIGSKDVQIGVHFDYEDNIFLQVQGHKRFCLISPQQSGLMYASEYNITQSDLNDASAPDLERFPLFSKATIIDDVVGPGEMLVIPRTWWHHFRSLDETISINCFFNRAEWLSDLAPIINQYGPRYWMRVAEQFVSYGLLGKPLDANLYSHPPNGLVLYESLTRKLGVKRLTIKGSFFE